MKRIFIIKCILLSAICTFAQIENYISDNIYQNCDKKCYVLIKIPEVIYKEIKDDSMVTARINEESRTLLREIGQKEIAVINNNQLDTIKYCNSAILLVNVKNYTKKGGRIGLAAGAVIVNFIYFKNVNNVKSDKETEITGTGQAVWGDLNVFLSAYQDAVNQYNDIVTPKKVKFKPIKRKDNLSDE